MPALPYFPIFPKDIFSDDRMNEMKAEDRGLFLLFLCKLWVNENEIIDDDSRTHRILGIPLKRWESIKRQLLKSGLLKIEDGCLKNNRLTYERERTIATCEKRKKSSDDYWEKVKSRGKRNKEEEYDGIPRDSSGKKIIKARVEDVDDPIF